MKSEQLRIGKAIKGIDNQNLQTNLATALIEEQLDAAIDLATNLTSSYQKADLKIRRAMNQVMFNKIFIDEDESLSVELREPFDVLLSKDTQQAALKHALAVVQEPDALDRELKALYEEWASERTLCLAGAAPVPGKRKTPQSELRGLNIELLVGDEGFEPPTLSV